MVGGVRGGAAITNKNHEKIKEVSKNIVKYLDMKEAGHYMYGMGYLFCQVIRCPLRIKMIKFIMKKMLLSMVWLQVKNVYPSLF